MAIETSRQSDTGSLRRQWPTKDILVAVITAGCALVGALLGQFVAIQNTTAQIQAGLDLKQYEVTMQDRENLYVSVLNNQAEAWNRANDTNWATMSKSLYAMQADLFRLEALMIIKTNADRKLREDIYDNEFLPFHDALRKRCPPGAAQCERLTPAQLTEEEEAVPGRPTASCR